MYQKLYLDWRVVNYQTGLRMHAVYVFVICSNWINGVKAAQCLTCTEQLEFTDPHLSRNGPNPVHGGQMQV